MVSISKKQHHTSLHQINRYKQGMFWVAYGTLINLGNNGNYGSSAENGINVWNLNFDSTNAKNNHTNSFSVCCALAFSKNIMY